MPRTIWVKEYATDQNKSLTELRDDAEEWHWSSQRRYFEWCQHANSRLHLEKGDEDKTEYKFGLSVIHGNETVNLPDLPDDAIRTFCFKDCALYSTARATQSMFWRCDLYWRIYRRWFPSRAEDTDISHGNFFCSLIRDSHPDTESMSAFVLRLTDFHRALCDQISKKLPTMPPVLPTGISGKHSTQHLKSPSADYRLRPTFEKCFMIIHAANDSFRHAPRGTLIEDPGAFVVWLQPTEMPEVAPGMTELSIDFDGIVAYQCDTVDTAMQFILSAEPDRSVRRREWHGYYKEELDQNDNMYGTLCQCTWCR